VHESTMSRRRHLGTGSIALSLGLSLCAGQLVATQPAAAATPVVTAAARTIAKVKMTSNTRTILYGKTVKLAAKVTNPKTGKVVTAGQVALQVYRKGKWSTWQTKSSRSFIAKPLTTASLRFKFLGGGGLYAGISNGVRVTVKNNGSKVVNEAAKHKGALYLYGASGPRRFDCSGFTMYVYRKTTGRKLPHKANSQQKYGKAVSKGKKQVGDLIIYRSGSYGYHAAIYAGAGKIWDSPHSGARVSKRKMFGSNYVVRRLV
jgi:cell wall-associated NlpC family hydrolase